MSASTDDYTITDELIQEIGLGLSHDELRNEAGTNPAALNMVALIEAMARRIATYRETAASVQREMQRVIDGAPADGDSSTVRKHQEAAHAASALREPMIAAVTAYRMSHK